MDERSRPRVGALDCPALGLVLQLTALIALPGQLSLCVAMVLENQEPGMTGPIALQLVAAGLQIATGVAVARRASARPLFAAWCVAALAAAVSAAIVLGDSDIALVLDAELFEIVAGPVMVLFAPLVIDVERLSDQRSPADVAAALLVLAMASLLALPLEFANYIRLWGGIRAASPGLLTSAPEWAPDAVLAIITLHAGRVLLRPGPPAAARKALVLYVVVSIAVGALHILGIVNVARGGVEGHATMLLSTPVIGLAIAVARPLLIWAYARPVLREPIAVERRALAGTLLWGVLWSVPLLVVSAGRAAKLHPESDALTIVVGALLCGQAICNVVAARAASRNPGRALLTASVASGICAVLLVTVVAWVWAVFRSDSMLSFRFSALVVGRPFVALLALLATLAWTQRSTPPELPRATVRSG